MPSHTPAERRKRPGTRPKTPAQPRTRPGTRPKRGSLSRVGGAITRRAQQRTAVQGLKGGPKKGTLGAVGALGKAVGKAKQFGQLKKGRPSPGGRQSLSQALQKQIGATRNPKRPLSRTKKRLSQAQALRNKKKR